MCVCVCGIRQKARSKYLSKSKEAAGCLGDFKVTRPSFNKQSTHAGTLVAIRILETRDERERSRADVFSTVVLSLIAGAMVINAQSAN